MIALRPQYPSADQAKAQRANTQEKRNAFRKQRQLEFFETEPVDGLTYGEYELFLLGFDYKYLLQRRLVIDDEHETDGEEDDYINVYESDYYSDEEYAEEWYY